MSEVFPGCHGVAVAPDNLGLELGWLTDRPPLAVDVELVDWVERARDAELVWQLDEPPAFGLPAITTPDLAGVGGLRLGRETHSICPCESITPERGERRCEEETVRSPSRRSRVWPCRSSPSGAARSCSTGLQRASAARR